jgi:hypothetical protein
LGCAITDKLTPELPFEKAAANDYFPPMLIEKVRIELRQIPIIVQ